MRTVFLLLISVLLGTGTSRTLIAQKLIRNSSVTGVCYAGNKVTRISIPPPEEFYRRAGSKGGGSVTVYYTGFSNQGKAAMEYAASILRSLLPSDTHLTIVANYEKISTEGVLAHTSVSGYVGGWGIDALNPMAFYPVALAEKISGEKINADYEGDLTLTVNSSINWYFGIDRNTPVNRYDLVTVALHEICHGLGFYDSMSTDATIGWYGIGSIPTIYDTFVENMAGKNLTDTLLFKNYSAALKSQFTTAPLYFNGPLLKYYAVLTNYPKTKAKLYVPSTWDPGSSVSHLDEDTFRLKDNALMTPYIDLGEAIHDPGKYTFSILADMGWINTRIIHQPSPDTEEHLSQLKIAASIKSDTLYKKNKVGIVFSFNKFLSSDTIFMSSLNSDNNFTATLTVPGYNTELQYYLFAEDFFSRLYRSPSYIKQFKHKVYIGTDTIKPVITHTPVSYYLETVDTIKYSAVVNDNLGLDTIYVEFKVRDKTGSIGLKKGTSDMFNAVLSASTFSLEGGDSIQYRIIARDKALVPNQTVLPASGYFSIHIENIELTVEKYQTDFSGSESDFFNDGFYILKPTGFSKFGLHTKHPYESPEDNDKSYNYTSMLRYPLKFNESGMLIDFSEIVMVEPGEEGSLFGSDGFYDYVIVEGSSDFGKSWFSLADGYDSRLFTMWESPYNNSIVGQNSTFVPTEPLLKNHTIFYKPSDKISAGDTLLLRFRLYSDSFANGWGWVIEDLKIRPLVDAIEQVSEAGFKIFPNPGKGVIRIASDIPGSVNGKPLHYNIINSSGRCISNGIISGDVENEVDISGNPTGIYILLINLDDGVRAFKYTLIK